MNPYEEINMLMQLLIDAWSSVTIECNGTDCRVSDPLETRIFKAPTLLLALRLAVDLEQEMP